MSKSSRIFAGVILLLLAVAVLVTPAPTLAAKKHQANAKGVITAIDTILKTVTILDLSSAAQVTVNVMPSTRIHKDNKEWATLADLAVGDQANARYDVSTMNAVRIQAKSPRVAGTITAIDLETGAVTIQPGVGTAVTVFATDTTKIVRNGTLATLADLRVGDHALARYNAVTMVASKIGATGE